MWLDGAELYHYKARAYDPQLGRFLRADPIGYGDGLNMYAYVGGDAVNSRDPSGTMATYTCTTTQIWQNGHGWVDGSQETTCQRDPGQSPEGGSVDFGGVPNSGIFGHNGGSVPDESCDGSSSRIVNPPSDFYSNEVHNGMANLNRLSSNGNEWTSAAFYNPSSESFGITAPLEGGPINSPGGQATGAVRDSGNWNVFSMHSHGSARTSVSDRFSWNDAGFNNLQNTTENLRVAFEGGINTYQGALMVGPRGGVNFLAPGIVGANSSASEIRAASLSQDGMRANFLTSPGDRRLSGVLAADGFSVSAGFSNYVVSPHNNLSIFRDGSGKDGSGTAREHTARLRCNVTA